MEYAVYFNRIAEAYESFLDQNAAWMKQQTEWRAEDLDRRQNWEDQEHDRFERRIEEDHKMLTEFHTRLERIYREEVQKDLDMQRINEFLKKKNDDE